MSTQRATLKEDQNKLREHLLRLLTGDGAHVELQLAAKDMPTELQGQIPKSAAHSPWEVLEHIRITQTDVLASILNPNHVSPEFPSGYWPTAPIPASATTWDACVKTILNDSNTIQKIVEDTSVDLLALLPKSEEQTITRKLMMLASHNSYHVGELVLLRRLLGAWQ